MREKLQNSNISKKIISNAVEKNSRPHNNTRRQINTVLRGNEKLFIKKFYELSDSEVEHLFNKYLYFYNNLPFDIVRTPEPKTFYGNTIEFEYVELPKQNALGNFLRQDELTKEKALEQTAKVLESIHSIGDAKKRGGYNHGDYWFGNIYLFSKHAYVIDFEAPLRFVRKKDDLTLLKSKEFDIAIFFDWYFSVSNVVFKRYLDCNHKYFSIFTSAYLKAGGKFNKSRYRAASRLLLGNYFKQIITANRTPVYKAPFHLMLLGVRTARNWRLYF